jgi:integrase
MAEQRTKRRRKLTTRFIESVKPPAAGKVDHTDAGAQGLVLRVLAASNAHRDGLKVWSVRYRPRGGVQRRETIGPYPAVKLVDARQRAMDVIAAAARGVDLPAEEERRRATAAATGKTLRDLLLGERGYIEIYAKGKGGQRRWKLTEAMLKAHIPDLLLDMRLVDLERHHFSDLFDELVQKKKLTKQVDNLRAQLRHAYKWGLAREFGLKHNVIADLPPRKLGGTRDKALKDGELRAVWQAASSLPAPSGQLVKAWILSGMRRDEMRLATWPEIDLEAGLMLLPAPRNKGGRNFEMPISPALKAVLESLPAPRRGYVFRTDEKGARAYSGQRRLKQIIDRESGVTGWVWHDLRRTMRTGLARLGIVEEVAELCMNHAQPSLVRVYNKHDYDEEKRRAFAAWGAHVERIAGNGAVVELRTA